MHERSESEVTQSCPTLHDAMDCSPPSPSIHGIFQARVLEWVAISFTITCHRAPEKKIKEGISVGHQRKDKRWPFSRNQSPGESKTIHVTKKQQLHQFILPPGGFLGGSDNKESTCNAGDSSSITESGRSFGEENGNPLQYSCLENPLDRGTWWATVHGVAGLDTTEQLIHTHAHTQQ